MGSAGNAARGGWVRRAVARLRLWLADASHGSLAQRMASGAFLIRVASAGLLFVSQAVLARWMGSFEFGIYVYVWTWVLLIGGLTHLGLGQAAQRFIPEYIERRRLDLLRGFITGSRRLVAALATLVAALAAGTVWLIASWLDDAIVLPLLLACLCLPFYALGGVLEGIGRSYNWLAIGLAPPYILRPLLLVVLMALAYAAGLPVDGVSAVLAAVGATWLATLVQLVLLDRRLAGAVAAGPKAYAPKTWLAASIPMFLAAGFYLLLTSTDFLLLKHFRSAQELAVYYAAAKTLALVAFVNFSVAAAVAHRFSEYHVSGERARLTDFVAAAVRWTFWPSLAATALLLALGRPLLWLFGPGFVDGYPLMFVLAIGLLARAAVGPLEPLLNMLGEQKVCAGVYALAFACNLALCLLLIPRYGAMGAAVSTSTALVIESLLLLTISKRRLGLPVFMWKRRAA